MSNVSALHFDCVVCQAAANNVSAEEQTLILLTMLLGGHTPEGIARDLCFKHRSNVRTLLDPRTRA